MADEGGAAGAVTDTREQFARLFEPPQRRRAPARRPAPAWLGPVLGICAVAGLGCLALLRWRR